MNVPTGSIPIFGSCGVSLSGGSAKCPNPSPTSPSSSATMTRRSPGSRGSSASPWWRTHTSPSRTNAGCSSRRPAANGASILLARAATPEQERFIGDQAGGRVFLFLATDDFDRDYAAYTEAGVTFIRPPAVQPYGKVAVFLDLYGNKWDLVAFNKPV